MLHPHASRGFRDWLQESASRDWVIAVGPEGGWDVGEVHEAGACGFEPVVAGPRTLRAETAGVLAVAGVQLMWGDLGVSPVTVDER